MSLMLHGAGCVGPGCTLRLQRGHPMEARGGGHGAGSGSRAHRPVLPASHLLGWGRPQSRLSSPAGGSGGWLVQIPTWGVTLPDKIWSLNRHSCGLSISPQWTKLYYFFTFFFFFFFGLCHAAHGI